MHTIKAAVIAFQQDENQSKSTENQQPTSSQSVIVQWETIQADAGNQGSGDCIETTTNQKPASSSSNQSEVTNKKLGSWVKSESPRCL